MPWTALLLGMLLWPAAAHGALWYDFNEPYASATGPEVKVFDWSVHRCDEYDIPDQPARAFRSASGQVTLIATHSTARRKTGNTLGSVVHQCATSFGSSADPDPSTWNNGEWLATTYTADGTTVYALVHNEYQGWRYGPGYCIRSGELWEDKQKCWYNSITLASSTNGGATFSHSAPPTHYVGGLPYRYAVGVGPSGFFGPSNIVRGRDGYHYVMLHVEGHGVQPSGSCLWRSRDLADPGSWRAWGGTGFTVRFLDPYRNDISDPAQHVCAPVGPEAMQTGSESLTWSTYFKKWLLVRATGGPGGTGFYVFYSDDLVNWWGGTQLMAAELPWAHTCGEPDYVLYPSLLDPDSQSRNFETTGQRPYLFFTHFNVAYNSGGCWMSVDRDLLRIPIEFSNQQPGGPSAALAASTTARPGEPVTFDASASRDADGEIVKHEWDLDGDGTYERDTGSRPVTERSYQAPGDVTVTVRVSDDDGKATDETRVLKVTGPAPAAAAGEGPGSVPASASRGTPAPAAAAALARFRLAAAPAARRDGSVVLRVHAPAAGRLRVRAAGRPAPIRRASSPAAGPGVITVRVRPSARGRALLGRRGRLRTKAVIAFTPVGGAPQSETRPLTLRAARR
jgi:hypothetical protein